MGSVVRLDVPFGKQPTFRRETDATVIDMAAVRLANVKRLRDDIAALEAARDRVDAALDAEGYDPSTPL